MYALYNSFIAYNNVLSQERVTYRQQIMPFSALFTEGGILLALL